MNEIYTTLLKSDIWLYLAGKLVSSIHSHYYEDELNLLIFRLNTTKYPIIKGLNIYKVHINFRTNKIFFLTRKTIFLKFCM